MRKIEVWSTSLLAISCTCGGSFPGACAAESNPAPIVNHVGLSVSNLEVEQQWYEKAFGMKVEQRFDLNKVGDAKVDVRVVLLRAPNGLGMELIERKGASRPHEFTDPLDSAQTLGYGHWALTVDDLNREFDMLVKIGTKVVSAPAPAVQAGSSFAYVKDPEGNLIELIQLPSHP